MSSTIVDGVRLDHIRRCKCGRRPEVSTGHPNMEPGSGPYIIRCQCDTPEDAVNENGFRPHTRFCRSWSKTRAVRMWRLMNQGAPRTAPANA